MPSGPGGLDANGVWQYGEADNPDGTASGLLNKLAASVSTKIGLLLPLLVAPPGFQVARGSTQAIPAATHTLVNAAYGTPSRNSGFTSFTAGVLTIDKAGIYEVNHNVLWPATATAVASQVLLNSTTPDSAAIVKKDYAANGQATGGSKRIRLAHGDVLRLYVYTAGAQNLGTNPTDLDFSVDWIAA